MCFKLIVVLFWLIQNGNAIKCYQCFLAERPYYLPDNVAVKTCKDFDYSDSFTVDCAESTFCYKRSVKDHFYKTDYVQVERGCAPQVYRGQKFNFNLGWSSDTYVVSNAYREGCKSVESYGLRSLNVEECYCDNGDLCNSGWKSRHSGLLLGVLLPVLCLLLNKV